MKFTIPRPTGSLDVLMSDGATIRIRRHGKSNAARLVLSHGNGFAADAYYPFWQYFLSDFDVIVFDQRNHGHNPLHLSGHTQNQMADDLQIVLDAIEGEFGKRTTIGAFHSLSAIVSLIHAARFGYRWDALILFDPPVMPPPGHHLYESAHKFEFALHRWALQRQRIFNDVTELASYLRAKRRMQRLVPGAAELMAQTITRDSGGRVELICPPELEADIYKQNSKSSAWDILPGVAKEIFVISSDFNAPDVDPPTLVNQSIQKEIGIDVVSVPETSHLLQIERPELVTSITRDHLSTRCLIAS